MCFDCTDVEKARKTGAKFRDTQNRVSETRSRALSAAMQTWFDRYARLHIADTRRTLRSGGLARMRRDVGIRKALWDDTAFSKGLRKKDFDRLSGDLFELLRKYGLAQAVDGAKDSAKSVGHSWAVHPGFIDDVQERIASKVVLLIDETEKQVRASIRQHVVQAMRETPSPSSAELGRRIARSWMGPALENPGTLPELGVRGSPEERVYTADWRRRNELQSKDREYIFSFSRSKTIARNEVANARSEGIAEGYTDAGIDKVRWRSYGNDGKSGKRKHWKMNNHRAIPVKDMNGSDRSKWFKLPNGERAPYPKWMGLTAFNSVNCRCVLLPARR